MRMRRPHGFEANTYLESALREVPMIPVLEGSTHINFGLTVQFINSYFINTEESIVFPSSVALDKASTDENPYWLEADDRNPKTVKFAPCLKSYELLRSVPNVQLFIEQVAVFRLFHECGKNIAVTHGGHGIAIRAREMLRSGGIRPACR